MVQEKSAHNICACAIVLSFYVVQEKNAHNVYTCAMVLSFREKHLQCLHMQNSAKFPCGAREKCTQCLCIHTNFPCGGSKYNAGIVEDLNQILLPSLN